MRGGELCTMTHLSAWAAGLWEFLLSGQRGRRGRGPRLHAASTSSSTRSACILQAQVCFQRSKGLLPNPHPTTGKSDLHKKPRPTTPRLPRTCGSSTRNTAAEREARGCSRGREKALPHRLQPSSGRPRAQGRGFSVRPAAPPFLHSDGKPSA